jgi:hypothetical protein
MSTAGNNFLSGLAQLADTVLAQTGAIVKMRAESAAKVAQGEIGLLNARFLADLQAVDQATGQYKIKPEQYEDAFAEHKQKLESFADEHVDFAPARDAVRSVAMDGLPELYVRGSMEMSKQVFAQIAVDKNKEYEMIGLDPLLSPEEKYNKRIAMIDNSRGGPLQAALEAKRGDVRFDYAMETLDALGTDEAIGKANDTTWQKEMGLDKAQATQIAVYLQNKGNTADSLGKENLLNWMKENPQGYLKKDEWDSYITDSMTAGGKANIYMLADASNAKLLDQTWQDQINTLRKADDGGLASLTVMRDRLIADKETAENQGQEGEEAATGKAEDDARLRTIDTLDQIIANLLKPDGAARRKANDDILGEAEVNFAMWNTKAGGPLYTDGNMISSLVKALYTDRDPSHQRRLGELLATVVTKLPEAARGSIDAIKNLSSELDKNPAYKDSPGKKAEILESVITFAKGDGVKADQVYSYVQQQLSKEIENRKPPKDTLAADDTARLAYKLTNEHSKYFTRSGTEVNPKWVPAAGVAEDVAAIRASEQKMIESDWGIVPEGVSYGRDGVSQIIHSEGKDYIFQYPRNGVRELHEIKGGIISKDVISTVKETSKKSAAEKEKAAGRTAMITAFLKDRGRMDLLDNIQTLIDTGEIKESDIPDDIKDNFRFKKAKP